MYTCLYTHYYLKISPCKALILITSPIIYSYSRSYAYNILYLYSDVFEVFEEANSLLSDISRLSDDDGVSD